MCAQVAVRELPEQRGESQCSRQDVAGCAQGRVCAVMLRWILPSFHLLVAAIGSAFVEERDVGTSTREKQRQGTTHDPGTQDRDAKTLHVRSPLADSTVSLAHSTT